MEVRYAKNHKEVDDAYELAASIFGDNYPESKQTLDNVRSIEPLENLEDAIVVADGTDIWGFVRILSRRFYSPIGLVAGGGITTVCIHPKLRGLGWGLEVMDYSIRRSNERGDLFSILFARRAVDGWYRKLGYVGIGCHPFIEVDRTYVPDWLQTFTGHFDLGVHAESSAIYQKAYEDSYRDMFLGFYRDSSWWRNVGLHINPKINVNDFINVYVGGKIIGYWVSDGSKIVECCSLAAHRMDFMAALISHTETIHTEKLILSLPPNHWCTKILNVMNHTLSVRYSWNGGHMVRILDSKKFIEIIPDMENPDSKIASGGVLNQYDVSLHEDAKELLESLVGSESPDSCIYRQSHRKILTREILPAWSIIDQL